MAQYRHQFAVGKHADAQNGMSIFNRTFFVSALVLLILALVPLGLFVAFTPTDPSSYQEIAQRTAHEYDRLVQLRQQQVFAVAGFPSVRGFGASTPTNRSQRAAVALNELQAWVAADTNIREAFIVDKSGFVIMTTLEGWNQDISARQFVGDALAGQIAVSPVAQDRGEFSNYYAAPLFDNEKEIAGALVIRVAAQELWRVTPRGEHFYAVLTDDNGTRLDDTGDPARRLATFGPLDAERAVRIAKTQLYGTQLPQPRATDFVHVQQLLTQGALDQLRPSDFGASGIGAQRMLSKPWSVLIVAPPLTLGELVARYALAVAAAVVLALGGAFVLARL